MDKNNLVNLTEHARAAAIGNRAARFATPTVTVDTADGPLSIQKAAIYEILPAISSQDKQVVAEFCNHVLFQQPLQTPAAKVLSRELAYHPQSGGFSQSVRDIVRVTYMCGGLHEDALLSKLEPEEVDMMRSGEKNIEVYLQRLAGFAAQEARIERNIKEECSPVGYERPAANHRVLHEEKPGLSKVLRDALITDRNIHPDRVHDFMKNIEAPAGQRIPDFVFYRPKGPVSEI